MFIHEIFKNADPKSLAMTGESNVTYGQLEKAVENYRNTLHAMGIRRGDTVGLYTANRAEFVYVYMAVVSLGAIIVPINNSLVDREVDFILRDAESKLLISDMPLTVSVPFIDISKHSRSSCRDRGRGKEPGLPDKCRVKNRLLDSSSNAADNIGDINCLYKPEIQKKLLGTDSAEYLVYPSFDGDYHIVPGSSRSSYDYILKNIAIYSNTSWKCRQQERANKISTSSATNIHYKQT